jgi:hypothetical protein
MPSFLDHHHRRADDFGVLEVVRRDAEQHDSPALEQLIQHEPGFVSELGQQPRLPIRNPLFEHRPQFGPACLSRQQGNLPAQRFPLSRSRLELRRKLCHVARAGFREPE